MIYVNIKLSCGTYITYLFICTRICFSVIRMPVGRCHRWPALVGWYQIITVKQWNKWRKAANYKISGSLYYLAAHHSCRI